MSGIIANLRDLVPIRSLSRAEALRVAELQATRLLQLSEVTEAPVPESVVAGLPRVQVERVVPSPVSGAAQWSRGRWLILLNGAESGTRQRFSLAHEFKHVLDNPFISVLYPPVGDLSSAHRGEQVCDYFAACLLMPRRWLKHSWGEGEQDLRKLSRRFGVSPTAMQVRLLQVGLVDVPPRCETEPAVGRRVSAAVRRQAEGRRRSSDRQRNLIDQSLLERLEQLKQRPGKAA